MATIRSMDALAALAAVHARPVADWWLAGAVAYLLVFGAMLVLSRVVPGLTWLAAVFGA